jgi:hypothetical protein
MLRGQQVVISVGSWRFGIGHNGMAFSSFSFILETIFSLGTLSFVFLAANLGYVRGSSWNSWRN